MYLWSHPARAFFSRALRGDFPQIFTRFSTLAQPINRPRSVFGCGLSLSHSNFFRSLSRKSHEVPSHDRCCNLCRRHPQPISAAALTSFMWKTRRRARIKPVIARDTTYSVSLLTCTTGGSNFAIPCTEISPHGNGVRFGTKAVSNTAGWRQARGDLALSEQ